MNNPGTFLVDATDTYEWLALATAGNQDQVMIP